MVWTTPATPVTLTVITTTFYIVNIRDNLNHLRALTGSADPGAAGLSLESDTATSAAWVGGKVSRAGDTMTSDLQVNRSGSAAPTTGYLILGNNGTYYVGFDGTKHVISTPAVHVQNDLYVYRIGAPSTGFLILGNNAANYIGFDGTNVVISGNKAWHQGNDGSGSGLDADLLRGLAPGSLSVANAANADQLDGIDSSGFLKVDGTPQTITANKTFILPGGATMDWGTAVSAGGGVKISGSFAATGIKSAAVTGPDEKLHSFAATEATKMYFEDYGTARVEDGLAYVEIPEDFRYYIDTEQDYYIWLTPYGEGHPWIAGKTPEAFIIGCSHDLRVDWRVTALRKDINQERLALIEPDSTASD